MVPPHGEAIIDVRTIDKKRKFLNEYIERIDVDYISKKQSHQIEIEFKLPLIDDSMNLDIH